MRTLTYTVGSALASASLFLAPAVPVAADDTNNSFNNTNTETKTVTVTKNRTINIGDCAVRFDDIKVWLDQIGQDQKNDDQEAENELEDELDDESSANQSNTQSQSNSQSNSQTVTITVAPNCSVTNVTHAAAGGQGAVLGARAEAAKGGVGAGVGGAASSFTALGAAVSALGVGLGLRRFGN